MIKEHNITKLKYLCITKRVDWEKYSGSGKYWLNHIKKHGNDIDTEVLYESEDYNDFLEKCIYFSALFDVVLNEEFANLVPEWGYNNGSKESNLEMWWKYASDSIKKEVISKRNISIKDNHWTKGKENDVIRKIISDELQKYWNEFSIEQRRDKMQCMFSARDVFFESKGEKYEKWKDNISSTMKHNFANMGTEEYEKLCERNSLARLNLSDEKKLQRKKKLQALHNTGKFDDIWDKMSKERFGIQNPAAKIVVYKGEKILYSKLLRDGISKDDIDNLIENGDENTYYLFNVNEKKEYDIIICPHCKKSSTKKPSSFKRWHFDNCKEKK